MDEFIQLCRKAGIDTSKTLVQIKEKWRGVFDKYKNVCDNNNRTGRDRKTCEFYDDIDEFMASSDKVNPKFVKETNVASQKRKGSDTEPGEDDNTKIKEPNQKKNPSPWVIYKRVTANGESIITQGEPNPSRNPNVPHGQEV